MSRERPLHGGCACGRNEYIIEMPPNAAERAQVIFDRGFGGGTIYRTSSANLILALSHFLNILRPVIHHPQNMRVELTVALTAHTHSSPLSAWLRVPLTWYHSTTFSFFDDETHSSIRRVYTPPENQFTKRHFCGYCGTPLSFWSEEPKEEKDYISLTLGSLMDKDVRDLGELGLLPPEAAEGLESPPPSGRITPVAAQELQRDTVTQTPVRVRQGLPWFESMIDGSQLGRVKVRRGEEEKNGRRVEWEIVEWTDGDGDEQIRREASPIKRQRTGEGDMGQSEGVDAD